MLHPDATSTTDADVTLASALAAALLPHFRASFARNTTDEVEAAQALESIKHTLTGSTAAPPHGGAVAAPLARHLVHAASTTAPPKPASAAKYTVRRVITCATYLRRLHVTTEMAITLLPDMSQTMPRDTMRAQANRVLFKQSLRVVDKRGSTYPVTYECLVSSGQRHARLSAGWATLMRRLQADLGDTVVLELHGERNDGVLFVRVEKGSTV